MLQAAVTSDGGDEEAFVLAPAVAEAPAVVSVSYESGGRYGAERRINKSAISVAVAIHVVLISALFLIRPAFAEHEEKRLQMVEMKLDSPPPAPDKQPETKPKTEVVKLSVVPQTPPPITLAATVPTVPTPPTVEFQPPAAPAARPAPPAPPALPTMVKAGDIGTQMISAKPPRYPMDARRKREQGTVVLSVTLGIDGRVSNVGIARSSGFASLDDAARSAVRQWRWAPTLRNGTPVMVQGVVEIPFVLQG